LRCIRTVYDDDFGEDPASLPSFLPSTSLWLRNSIPSS